MSQGTRQSGKNRNKTVRGKQTVGKLVTEATKGRKIFAPELPPQFTAAPWNQLTVVGVVKGTPTRKTDCFTINDLILAFQKQTGIKLPTLCFRLQKVYAWEMTNQPMEVAIDEMPDGTQCSSYSDSVTVLACYPGRVSYARIAYLWPLSSRLQIKTAAEGQTVIFRTSLQTTGQALYHIHVLWSTGQATLEVNEAKSSFEVTNAYKGYESTKTSVEYSFEELKLNKE